MCGEAETEAENVRHVFLREHSSMPLRESGEVRRRLSQRAGDRSMTFAVRAVAGRAVVFVNLSVRRDIDGR